MSKTIMLRDVPEDLLLRIDTNAAKRGVSRQVFLLSLLEKMILPQDVINTYKLQLDVIANNSEVIVNNTKALEDIKKMLEL